MTLEKRHKEVLECLAVILCFALIVFYFVHRAQDSLIKNRAVIEGRVDKMERFPKRGDIRIWYTYQLDQKIYRDQYHLYVDVKFKSDLERLLGGERMIVVYDTTNFDNSNFPCLQQDFERYKIEPPASLLPIYRTMDSLALLSE